MKHNPQTVNETEITSVNFGSSFILKVPCISMAYGTVPGALHRLQFAGGKKHVSDLFNCKCDVCAVNFLLDASTLNGILFSVVFFNLTRPAVALFTSSLPSIKFNYSYLWDVFSFRSYAPQKRYFNINVFSLYKLKIQTYHGKCNF